MIALLVTFYAGFSPLLAGASSIVDAVYPQNVFLTPRLYNSCDDAWNDGFKQPGIFPIRVEAPLRTPELRFIVCNNSDSHSSTVVLLRKKTGGEEFRRSFAEFRNGFGSAKSEYFLGLDNIHSLTRRGFNRLVITIRDAAGVLRQISYPFFKLKGPPDYAYGLSAPGVGNLPDDFWFHRNLPFRAPGNVDYRSDGSSCAQATQAGWWFQPEGPCSFVLLTGSFRPNRTKCHSQLPYSMCDGLYWLDLMGYRTLEYVSMELTSLD